MKKLFKMQILYLSPKHKERVGMETAICKFGQILIS